MKQLSHKSTGKVVRILKFNCDLNHVVYAEYEFGYTNESEPKLHPFTWSIRDSFSTTCIINDEIVNHLQSELFTDYIIEEDNQNWIVEKGSEDNPTTLRVYVPAKLLNAHLNTGSPVDLLIKEMAYLEPFLKRCESGSVQYLEELTEPVLSILENHKKDGVIIEPKESI